MNNDYDETDTNGCGLIAYLATLGFFLYACLTKGGTAGSWIAVFIGMAMLLGVAIYIRGTKKERQNNGGNSQQTQEVVHHVPHVDMLPQVTNTEIPTRILLQQTLAKLSLNYDFDENQNFLVEYQGETFIIRADNDSKSIHIHDGWWYEAPLDDIDNLSILYKAVNEHNISSNYTRIVYTTHQETQKIYLHILCDILWKSSISDIDEYLQAIFSAVLYSHHLFYQKMEELRRKDYANKN